MALPEGTKMGLDEFAERAENLLKFDAIFTAIYKEFLRLSENEMDKLNENMQEWLNDKLASQ